jgi:hypothetical protein
MFTTTHYCIVPRGLFCSGFVAKILYKFLITAVLVTCPTHLVLHEVIVLLRFDKNYTLHI